MVCERRWLQNFLLVSKLNPIDKIHSSVPTYSCGTIWFLVTLIWMCVIFWLGSPHLYRTAAWQVLLSSSPFSLPHSWNRGSREIWSPANWDSSGSLSCSLESIFNSGASVMAVAVQDTLVLWGWNYAWINKLTGIIKPNENIYHSLNISGNLEISFLKKKEKTITASWWKAASKSHSSLFINTRILKKYF